jgi:hypothetical protein
MTTATMERTAQIEYATITVQFVNEKKPGARNASIKDIDGAYYWVKPEMLQVFQPGGVYEISFTTAQSNGYTNRTIKSAEAQQPAPRPAPRAQASQGSRPAVKQSVPVAEAPPHQEPPKQPQNGNGGNYFRPTSPKDAKRMFICSQLNAIITSRQVAMNAQAIADTITMLTDAYDATIGLEDQE